MEKNRSTHFEVVREFVDKWHNVDDYEIIDSFNDYKPALASAKEQEVIQGRQISVWEVENNTLDLVNSWVIKIFLNGKAVTLD